MNARAKKSDPYTPDEVLEIHRELENYESLFDQAEADISMKGKMLGDAQREQASLSYFYGVRKVELSIMLKRAEARMYAIRGRLHRWFKENDALSSSERQIDKYIDTHEEYIASVEVMLYVEEVYKKFVEIEEALTKRGFAIRDYTEARIKEVYKDVI